jgi:ADP-ribose pyrophosphatase YjhB (NUDIX family)
MLKRLLGWLWRSAPKVFRRWGVRLTQPRFMVTAGAVVCDERGRVLLLKHVFRKGSGWGIPGGFLNEGEHPEDALRRELREEVGAELDAAELAFARTLQRPQQIEIIFRCSMRAAAVTGETESFEIKRAGWFEADALPPELGADQRRIIRRVLGGGAPRLD